MKLHSLYPAVDLSFASQQFSRHGDVSTSVVDVQIRAVFFQKQFLLILRLMQLLSLTNF